MKAEEVTDIVEKMLNLDIAVSSDVFRRDFKDRFLAIAKQLEVLENETGQSPITNLSCKDLDNLSPLVVKAYQKLLEEVYEQCALLEVMGRVDGKNGATEMWRHYLFLADGHPDQKERLQIAKEHLAELENKSGNEDLNVQKLNVLRQKQTQSDSAECGSSNSKSHYISKLAKVLRELFD